MKVTKFLAPISISCVVMFSCEFGSKKVSLPKQQTSPNSSFEANAAPADKTAVDKTAIAGQTETVSENKVALGDDAEPLTAEEMGAEPIQLAQQAQVGQPTPSPIQSEKIAMTQNSTLSGKDYRLSGAVTAPRKSVLTFRVGGFIDKINVKSGDRVKAGDVLAELDRKDYELRYSLANARREQAQIATENANKDFKREKELKTAKATTNMAFDRVSAGYQSAEVNLKMAELDMSIAQKALDDTKLVAPYDCVIAQQFRHVGEQVGAGGDSRVFEVYDTAAPEISLAAPEKMMGQVKVGDELNVTIPAVSYAEKAKVIRVVPAISNATRTFEVVVQFIKVDDKVVPGHFAEAVFKAN